MLIGAIDFYACNGFWVNQSEMLIFETCNIANKVDIQRVIFKVLGLCAMLDDQCQSLCQHKKNTIVEECVLIS